MYATVTHDTRRIVVYGPPRHPGHSAERWAVAICPPGAADRTSGTLAEA